MTNEHAIGMRADERGHLTSDISRNYLSPAVLERLRRRIALADPHRKTAPVLAPFTGGVIGTIPVGVPADVDEAIRRARHAQPGWAARRASSRGAVLVRFHDLLLGRREEALDLIQLESGKARRHALEEILDTALVARHYGFRAAKYLRVRRRAGALPGLTMTREYRQPVGVVGIISPWNFPLILGITDALAALAAGNAVVLRPDEQGSLTALWAVDLLYEAGLPSDVLQVVTGPGPELGPPLIEGADFIMFTGSTRTGRIVARQAASSGCAVSRWSWAGRTRCWCSRTPTWRQRWTARCAARSWARGKCAYRSSGCTCTTRCSTASPSDSWSECAR